MELVKYEENVKRVPIEKVYPNSWNPKDKGHSKVEDVKRSIQKNGFKQPVQVRSHPEKAGEYEIIDGEQRFTAMVELGATEIYINDNGEVKDEDAKSETLWWQVQVPFETVALANLVTELSMMEMELPYNPKELAEFKEMSEFDFDKYDTERPEDEELNDNKSFTVELSSEQYEVVTRAIERIKEENDCGDARALELMAADFLAS